MGERSIEGEGEGFGFLVDHMLGTLARNLRMFGCDAEFARHLAPEALMQRAAREGRWLLTRRDLSGIAHRPMMVLRVEDDDPALQVVQVLRAVSFQPQASRWFTRCLRCNLPLHEMPAERARQMVPEHIALTHSRFRHCPSCGRIFWKGTHAVRMREVMERWLEEARVGRDGSRYSNASRIADHEP